MHDSHLLKNMFNFLDNEEASENRKIKKISVSLSEFGSFSKEHFLEHFNDYKKGTKWNGLKVAIEKIPFGPEFELTKIEYVQ